MTSELRPFHLAIPVTDLEASRIFYIHMLGCEEGRSAERWIDFNFFGHQVSVHLVDEQENEPETNTVDNEQIPARHFGLILTMQDWKELEERLRNAEIEFVIEPTIRFQGQAGEQATMFLSDPSGNMLEYKAFAEDTMIFSKL